jgi:competence protein ComEC
VSAHDPRLTPAAVCAWLSAWLAVVLGMRWQSPLIAAITACLAGCILPAAMWARARSQRAQIKTVVVLALIITCGVCASTGIRVHGIVHGPVSSAAQSRASVAMNVVLTGDPQVRFASSTAGRAGSDQIIAAARASRVEWRGQIFDVRVPVRLRLTGDLGDEVRPLLPGTRLRIEGVAHEPRPGDRASAIISVREVLITADPPVWHQQAGRIRAGLRQAVSDRPADAAALLPGLSIGDTSLSSADLVQDMRSSGLAHLTVVSGANVTIVLISVFALLGLLRVHGRRAVVVAGVVLACFVMVARPDPSVLRAAVMGAVALFAIANGLSRTLSGGSRRSLAALSFAVIVLVTWDPWLATSWGFALSVTATTGLIVAARPVAQFLGRRLPPWGQPLADATAVAAVAQAAVTPVLLLMGATVGPWAVPANVLAAPAVAPATISGLAAAVVSPMSPAVARAVALPGTWATQWIAGIARFAADDQFRLGRIGWTAPWTSWPPRDWDVLLCDVGQGTALVVRTVPGHALLFDAGPDDVKIDSCLRRLGISVLDAIVVTHFHADHVDGMAGAMRNRLVGQIFVPPLSEPAARAAQVSRLAQQAGVPVVIASAGQKVSWASVTWQVLWPVSWVQSPAPENDHSVVSLVHVDGLDVLIPGDIEYAAQQELLALLNGSSVTRGIDVLVMPHHGSRKQDPRLAEHLRPAVVLIGVGQGNEYGHPHPQALTMYRDLGSSIGRTDTDGPLAVIAQDGNAQLLARR